MRLPQMAALPVITFLAFFAARAYEKASKRRRCPPPCPPYAHASAPSSADAAVNAAAAARLFELQSRSAAEAAEAALSDKYCLQFLSTFSYFSLCENNKVQPDVFYVLSMFGVPIAQPETEAGLRKAIQKAALWYHPDRNVGATLWERVHAEEAFKAITSAHQAFVAHV